MEKKKKREGERIRTKSNSGSSMAGKVGSESKREVFEESGEQNFHF